MKSGGQTVGIHIDRYGNGRTAGQRGGDPGNRNEVVRRRYGINRNNAAARVLKNQRIGKRLRIRRLREESERQRSFGAVLSRSELRLPIGPSCLLQERYARPLANSRNV